MYVFASYLLLYKSSSVKQIPELQGIFKSSLQICKLYEGSI